MRKNHRIRGEGKLQSPLAAKCQYKNRMSGRKRCQRKMHGNYPSVAKACTLTSLGVYQMGFRGPNRKRSKKPGIAGSVTVLWLERVGDWGVAGFRPVFAVDLAPKVLHTQRS